MSSVTGRITEIKQPRGGYIKPSQFNAIVLDDGVVLNPEENVHGSIVGMSVDYLTRFMMGAKPEDAFKISLLGADFAKAFNKKAPAIAQDLLRGIKDLDDKSIINACKLVAFDAWFRNPMAAMMAKQYDEINPDKPTIDNIRILVSRSLKFFSEYGPIVKDGFTFEPNGYTSTVDSGDGDFLTADTLWDFKVSTSKPTSKHTLQLLMYWIMGQHSGQPIYKSIDKLGIFNPRLNTVYLLNMSDVPSEVITEVEQTVIVY